MSDRQRRRRSTGERPQPLNLKKKGLVLKRRPSALIVAYLEGPNHAPLALMSAFSEPTTAIQLRTTGSSVCFCLKTLGFLYR